MAGRARNLSLAPLVQELAPGHAMLPEEEAEHGDGRDEVAAEDGPPRDGLEQPLGENGEQGGEEDLEAAEQHHQPEEEPGFAIVRVRFPARDVAMAIALSLGTGVTILDPHELRADVVACARMVLERYA